MEVHSTTLAFAHVCTQAGGSGGPLSECTNKRGGGQLAPAPAKKQHTQQDVQEAIDLCDDDDDTPAAAAAALPPHHTPAADVAAANHQEPQQQQGSREEPEQQLDDGAMEVDGAAGPAPMGSLPASRAASLATQDAAAPAAAAATPAPAVAATPAPAAGAASSQQEPATPAGALTAAAGGAAAVAAPSAIKSTGGKAAAETPLTPDQRQQLLETCQQVGGQPHRGTLACTRRLCTQHQLASTSRSCSQDMNLNLLSMDGAPASLRRWGGGMQSLTNHQHT